MSNIISEVLPSGPPLVRIATGAKIRKLETVSATRTKVSGLLIKGNVMSKVCLTNPAPSIRAAS